MVWFIIYLSIGSFMAGVLSYRTYQREFMPWELYVCLIGLCIMAWPLVVLVLIDTMQTDPYENYSANYQINKVWNRKRFR